MKDLILKLFNIKKKRSFKDRQFLKFKNSEEILKIFNSFSSYSDDTEIRFVGGCLRKILNKEESDDIDLATNVNPDTVKNILESNNIKYHETGIDHGTITAIINKKKFEITSLRKDILTDGRHAKVTYTNNWIEDASRRDFSINSIYSDLDGNLYDPYNGRADLKNGLVKFIGDPEKRITEDYLRILRYLRFFLNYSKQDHDEKIKKIIKKNISGIKHLSKERLIDELKKIVLSEKFTKISFDQFSMNILELIFPELKNLSLYGKINSDALKFFKNKDFIFRISLCIIDETDNANYFLYKYNFSNKDKKRILFLKENFKNLDSKNFFKKYNLLKILYHYDSLYLEDLIDFKIFNSKSRFKDLIQLKQTVLESNKPIFPIKTKKLIEDYNLVEGKELGIKIKKLENIWINNNFKISKEEIEKTINS